SDLFSLGSVLYACCTGHPPFRGETAVAVLRRVTDEAPPSLREENPAVPTWLETVVDRLLAKNPADRFSTAAEVATLVAGDPRPRPLFAPPCPPPAPPPGRAGRSPLRRWLWLSALLAAVVGLAGFLLVEAPPPPQPAQQPAAFEFYEDFRGAGPLPPTLVLHP